MDWSVDDCRPRKGEHAEMAWAYIADFRRAKELERVIETLNTYAYMLESVLGEEPGE